MESQEQSPGDVVTAGEDSHPITQAIDAVEVTHAGATAPAANTMDPPTIPLAPMKRMQARFNPLADGLMYVVVFVGGFVGVGCRHALDMLLPSVSGTPFVVGTFVSNMVACFLFAMLTEFMATASWLRRRVRQVVSRGVGLGLLGGLSTMSGVMLETMEGLHERHIASALGYLAGNFAGGLLTAAAGVVIESGWKNDSYGYAVMIDHGNGRQTLYGHCSSVVAEVGDWVETGQTVALVGSTGNSTGPHVHFEIRLDGVCVDPLLYLPVNDIAIN